MPTDQFQEQSTRAWKWQCLNCDRVVDEDTKIIDEHIASCWRCARCGSELDAIDMRRTVDVRKSFSHRPDVSVPPLCDDCLLLKLGLL